MTKIQMLLLKEIVVLITQSMHESNTRRLRKLWDVCQQEHAATEKGLAFRWGGRLPE